VLHRAIGELPSKRPTLVHLAAGTGGLIGRSQSQVRHATSRIARGLQGIDMGPRRRAEPTIRAEAGCSAAMPDRLAALGGPRRAFWSGRCRKSDPVARSENRRPG
jgi:hypothetical protein